jgi:hypothetical protein
MSWSLMHQWFHGDITSQIIYWEIKVRTFRLPTAGEEMWPIKRFCKTYNTLRLLRLKISAGMVVVR